MKAAIIGILIMGSAGLLVFLFGDSPIERAQGIPFVDTPAIVRPAPTSAPLIVEDPVQLAALEADGLSAGELMFGKKARTVAELLLNPGWHQLVGALSNDLEELYGKDRNHGVGMRFTHRGFDPSWLISGLTRFELAAIVNRVDRRAFARGPDGSMTPGACGELRFIYRLAYDVSTRSGPFQSRLPMTLNVVFFHPSAADCSHAARALERDLQAELRGLTPKSVEVNVQTVRWPSTIRPDLGGHAEYVLRVFAPDGSGGLAPAPLENTPDVDRILATPALRARALAWLQAPETATAAERGLALMPEDLAATRAVSVTPRGLARPHNRPFTRLMRAIEKTETPARALDAALLRRLDGLSCMGCHQSRSVAGFHILGPERDPLRRVDALAVAHSPHVHDELARRRAYADALLRGEAPIENRPPAERADPSDTAGVFGAACGLSGFNAWGCAEGLRCVAVDDDEIGQCQPELPTTGAACRPGTVGFKTDRIARTDTLACAAGAVCEGVPVGFPGGMCAATCAAQPSDATCGAIALLTPFNDCLARGELFSRCAEHARPAALRRCDQATACRPDYVCAQTQTGAGACLPPYFVLQMRVDGHPLPPHPRWRSRLQPP